MEYYLRGVTKCIKAPSHPPGQLFQENLTSRSCTRSKRSTNVLSILLVFTKAALLDDMQRIIRNQASLILTLEVESMTDGRLALRAAQNFDYDVILSAIGRV